MDQLASLDKGNFKVTSYAGVLNRLELNLVTELGRESSLEAVALPSIASPASVLNSNCALSHFVCV